MGRVGHELAHLGFALLPGLEGAGHVVQHEVEGMADAAHFSSGMGRRRRYAHCECHLTGVERKFRNLRGDFGELLQRRMVRRMSTVPASPISTSPPKDTTTMVHTSEA